MAFERDTLQRLGAPAAVGMNHRLTHFQHLFSGSFYAAQYYVYLWAEVLDCDAYEAFVEAGDPFDAATARSLLDNILAVGNSRNPAPPTGPSAGVMPRSGRCSRAAACCRPDKALRRDDRASGPIIGP